LSSEKRSDILKMPQKVYTAKNGAKYIKLKSGRCRFVKGPPKKKGPRKKTGKRKRKGGSLGSFTKEAARVLNHGVYGGRRPTQEQYNKSYAGRAMKGIRDRRKGGALGVTRGARAVGAYGNRVAKGFSDFIY
jgi:hypothetical protein